MEKNVIYGIPRTQLLEYLHDLSSQNLEERFFYGSGWEIEIGPQYFQQFFQLRLPRTKITFRGEISVVKDLLQKFWMKFLTAGG